MVKQNSIEVLQSVVTIMLRKVILFGQNQQPNFEGGIKKTDIINMYSRLK